MRRIFGVAVVFVAVVALGQTVPDAGQIAAKVNPNDLRADVSFLGSDALEGRATPSRGLDIAAEYIAAQFRRAGLESAGDDRYFQTASYVDVKPRTEGMELILTIDGHKFVPDRNAILVLQPGPLDLQDADAVVLPAPEPGATVEVTPGGTTVPSEKYAGKIVIVNVRNLFEVSRGQPKLTIIVDTLPGGASFPRSTFREASERAVAAAPVVFISDPVLRSAVQKAKGKPASVSASIPGPAEEPVNVRNVVGLLRGSDPVLKNECVVVSAHYDHAGMAGNVVGDNILNGANDDASGTAGVIAIAKALSALESRPKRSVVFLALFGEERGRLGSRYYVRHPVFSMAETIANINLEQIGRTDSTEGPRLLQFNLTGHDYTTLATVFEQASQGTGVQVIKDAANTERYFTGSDNLSFAEANVPSTTISVTYQFADYHAPGDEWEKLDYENMTRVTGAIAAAVFRLADSSEAPRWNSDNPRTARYAKAREKTRPK